MKPRALRLTYVTSANFGSFVNGALEFDRMCAIRLARAQPSGGAHDLFRRFFCGWFLWGALAPLPLSLYFICFAPLEGCEATFSPHG